MQLLTIGHSNQTIESFMALLQKYEVNAIADVQSHPLLFWSKNWMRDIQSNKIVW
jgi:hypothetical protein